MKRANKIVMLLAVFVIAAFSVAQADVIVLVPSPAGASASVDWSQLNGGVPNTVLPHAFVAFSSGGDTATASFSGAVSNKGELVEQGSVVPWKGNFNTGEFAVWTTNHGPLTVSFGNSYNFVGAYFQQQLYGTFTAKLQVYAGSTLLGSVTESGVSNFAPGTAMFIGALDKSGPNITKVIFSETAGNNLNDFAIATMYLGTVPEPGTMVLVGTGLIGLASIVRRRTRT